MELIKKVIHVCSIVTYVLITVYALCCIPILFKYHPVVVLSGSMKPTYKVGSIIYYKKIPLKELKKGDVITFSVDNKVVSHRIVKIDNNLIETKGDANKISDINKVNYKDVLGKVGKISIPFIGYFIKTVNSHLTIFIIVMVVVLLSEFIISNIDDGRKED